MTQPEPKMLRIATSAILIPVLWGTIKLAPPLGFSVIALAMIGIAIWECYRMLEAGGSRPFKWLGLIAGLGVAWSFVGLAPQFEPQLPLAMVAIATFVLAMRMRSDADEMLASSVHTLFPVLLVGLGLGFLIGLRGMPGEDGEDLLMLLFVCVVFADTAAFYVGSRLGRRRMAPTISPRKSWEGAVGGMTASALAGLIAHFWFYQRLPLIHALALGLVLGLAAILGDLTESMIKRATGVKDSSTLLPGHGGLLDRADSLLFAGPVLYYYYRWFLQGAA